MSRQQVVADAFCRQDADHSSRDICEQEIDFPWVPASNNDEPDADAAPFLPRFLLQEIIFAHCRYLLQPSLRGILLCKSDWLCLRGIAGCECTILPIQEIATDSKCSVCVHASSGEHSTARRSLPALEPVNKFCWQPAETQQQTRRDERIDEFDTDAVTFHSRFVLQELIFVHCSHQPRSPIRRNFVYKADWLSLRGIAGTECDTLPIR